MGAQPDDAILSPDWGSDGARLRWSGASLPAEQIEILGSETGSNVGGSTSSDGSFLTEVAAHEVVDNPDAVLRSIATRDVSSALDLLFSLVPSATGEESARTRAAARRLVGYCRFRERLHPGQDQVRRYPWLASVVDDEAFLDRLWAESSRWTFDHTGASTPIGQQESAVEVLGGRDQLPAWLSRARRSLRNALARGVGSSASAVVVTARALLGQQLAQLAGDALVYLGQRGDVGSPGSIARTVATAIESAHGGRGQSGPLVIVAHSLGGVIAYDVLTRFRPDLTADLLVTVGSQVGLFAELALLGAEELDPPASGAPPGQIEVPPNVRNWLNVVDWADPLAFHAERIFDRVTDYRYRTSAVWAHTTYLRQPMFHARLADRIRKALA
ncbi:MAG: hypothetical protein JXA67_02150 [Micromonosporaceae bacterium]|nr:hypothetical protein [Micromonosporaceae bacterium]